MKGSLRDWRRGVVVDVGVVAGGKVVQARVPLAELFGYANDLASLSQGRAQPTVTPDGYQAAPRDVQTALLRQAG